MTILDIDMDFFQNGIHTNDIDSDKYLNDSDISVWNKADFIAFLEKQCHLSQSSKIKGRIIKHHIEAFDYWNQLVQKGELCRPFKVIHIDAHSDLGFSINEEFYRFLKSIKTMQKKPDINTSIFDGDKKRYINSGNYLLCAVIDNMVSEIDYIYHDKLDYLDVTNYIVECIEPNKSFRFIFSESILQSDIHLNLINKRQFNITEPIDYVTIAISPSFVKKEILGLLDVIKNYIELDDLSL